MTDSEAAAQAQLQEIVRELEATRFRLLGIRASLPPTPIEMVRFVEDEPMDTPTDVRTVVQCVLEDFIRPAIRDLRAAADRTAAEGDDETSQPQN